MTETSAAAGLAVILLLYASVGVFAVVGSAVLTQRYLPARWEQAFYGAFLVAIGAFYLAFIAYFRAEQAWTVEVSAIALFCLLGLAGMKWRLLLIAGYVLHGLWDLVHELQALGGVALFEAGSLTAIPLAYGVFCGTFDLGVAIYAVMRREAWAGAAAARN